MASRFSHVTNFVDQTTVTELRALMDLLDCYIAPDTGPLHIAYSSSVPTVGLYGPTRLELTGPPAARNRQIVLKEETVDQLAVNTIVEAVVGGHFKSGQ